MFNTHFTVCGLNHHWLSLLFNTHFSAIGMICGGAGGGRGVGNTAEDVLNGKDAIGAKPNDIILPLIYKHCE